MNEGRHMSRYGEIDYMPKGFHVGGSGDDEHTWDGHLKPEYARKLGQVSEVEEKAFMIDITNCYFVVFRDDAGMVHSIPFAKGEGSHKRMKLLEEALAAAGMPVERFIPRVQAAKHTEPAES